MPKSDSKRTPKRSVAATNNVVPPTSEPSQRFLNRELSWLEFNQRVLDEARDESIPLLERLRFLAITASNLDEFFMVRIGGLQILAESGSAQLDVSGMTCGEQLAAVRKRTRKMLRDQYATLNEQIEPALREQAFRRYRRHELTDRQLHALEQIFDAETSSVLTPIGIPTEWENAPLLASLTLHACVRLHSHGANESSENQETSDRFAIIPFGKTLPRFLTVTGDRGYGCILLEDAVEHFAGRFFPGEEVVEFVPFRITRNADMSVQEDHSPDFLREMSEVLNLRKRSDCVRLEISDHASETLVHFLSRLLDVAPEDVFMAPGPVELAAFFQLADVAGFDHLRNEPWPAASSPDIEPGASMFEVLSRKDVLLFHPYQGFDPVVQLIEQASADPDVLAIKQILYRTSRKSPIVAALARAAERGKYVTAIVELKARFDEARNIEWARSLEQAGVQVIYGVKGFKTHAKVCVIVRREPHGIQRYVHFGTGNYNEITAKIYSDASLLTSNEELGADAVSFFNAIAGLSLPPRYRKIEAAPLGLRGKILELILGEAKRQEAGGRAQITAKLNSLVDPEIINALYNASNAGVRIRLNIRGICCLRPGVPRLSENIEIVSIVDRFLEHARILRFHHGGDELVFISSADWMPRNLDGRIELLTPIEDPDAKRRLIEILDMYFDDNVKGKRLLADGSYESVSKKTKKKSFRCQEKLYEEAQNLIRQAQSSRRTVFEPHRAPGTAAET